MPDANLRNCRILVVEDEYMLADGLREVLEDRGAVVLGPVASVGKALALVAGEQTIDAAVLDVNLGGERVFPVADALLARHVPLVFTTGYSEQDVPTRYAGLKRCEKPVEPREILKAIAREMSST